MGGMTGLFEPALYRELVPLYRKPPEKAPNYRITGGRMYIEGGIEEVTKTLMAAFALKEFDFEPEISKINNEITITDSFTNQELAKIGPPHWAMRKTRDSETDTYCISILAKRGLNKIMGYVEEDCEKNNLQIFYRVYANPTNKFKIRNRKASAPTKHRKKIRNLKRTL